MEMQDVLDVAREGVIVMIKISAPAMLTALAVGLVVSMFQALTQIQEMTLSFVPKMLAIFASLLLFLPFMLATLITYTQELASRIATGGG
ncbi:MAG: flagellar biosynthesis protein FliQ [Alphaproteobacteria bacterium]|nr:flagellar biosynthesis protein FliQ [Alphaproteobacteria bacterium]